MGIRNIRNLFMHFNHTSKHFRAIVLEHIHNTTCVWYYVPVYMLDVMVVPVVMYTSACARQITLEALGLSCSRAVEISAYVL